jgi:hypothetical protein
MGYLQKLQAVIELPLERELPCPWTISFTTPLRWIQLSGEMTPAEIGLAVALLIQHNQLDLAGDMTTVLEQLLAATELIWLGGLQAIGEGDRHITSGCCCGLETWREWPDFLHTGQTPWLGHSPSPWLATAGELIKIWSDGGQGESLIGAFSIDVSRADLQAALRLVERDLQAFLWSVESWAQAMGFPHSRELRQQLDRCFNIGSQPTIYD